ncbi:hypothetical protein L249_3651, partial [Ophiocordyceps polyrhachis-furcata BCC 54312]
MAWNVLLPLHTVRCRRPIMAGLCLLMPATTLMYQMGSRHKPASPPAQMPARLGTKASSYSCARVYGLVGYGVAASASASASANLPSLSKTPPPSFMALGPPSAIAANYERDSQPIREGLQLTPTAALLACGTFQRLEHLPTRHPYKMRAKSSAVPVALALIGIVAAGPDPEKPRIYFPREITRHTYNSTSSTSQVLTTTESELPTSSDNALSTERLIDELFSELSSKTEAAPSDLLDNPTLTPAVPPTLADTPGGTGNLPPVAVPPTFVKSAAKSTSGSSSQENTKGLSSAKSDPGPAYSSGPSSHDGVQSPSSAKSEPGLTSKPEPSSSGSLEAPPSSAKTEPSPSSRPVSTRHNGLDLPSDTSIVIDINGIVTPTPTLNSGSREDHASSHPSASSQGAQQPPITDKKKLVEPNATDMGTKSSSTDLGGATPTSPANGTSSRPEEPPAASSSAKNGLVAPVGNLVTSLLPVSTASTTSSSHVDNSLGSSSVLSVPTSQARLSTSSDFDGSHPVPIPSNRDVFSRPGGTGAYTTPTSASSTEAGVSMSTKTAKMSAPTDIDNSHLVPIPSNHDVFSRPGGTGVYTSAAPASSTEVGVSASTKSAPIHSQTTSLPESAEASSSDGFGPSPTSRSESESDEASTAGILPVVTSKAGIVTSLTPVVNSLVPGPANSTAASTGSSPETTALSTGSLLEPTDLVTNPTVSSTVLVSPSVKPPNANLTTGLTSLVTSSAKDIAPETFISRNSSGYTSLETATQTTSDKLVPLLSSLLTPASTTLSAQPSSSLANNTSVAVLPTPTSQHPSHPPDISNATITNTTSSVAQVSATSPTSTETAVSTETTDSSALPTIAPVINSTSSMGSTRLSTPPALNATSTGTLESTTPYSGPATTEPLPTTSAANSTESKTSPYRFPPSSSLMHTASSSSSHSSHQPATTVTPVETSAHPSSIVESTEHKTSPSSTTVSQQPSSSQSPSEAPQPPPTSFPKYIAPSKPAASAPVGTRNITIALNNMVVNSGIDAISTYNIISRLLPSLISLGLASGSADKVVVFSLERCGGSAQSFNFLAHTSFPDNDGFVSQLQMNLGLANSPIYTTNATELGKVIKKNLAPGQSMTPTDTQAAMKLRDNLDKFHNITMEHCITRGTGKGAANGGSPGSGGDGQNGPNPGNQSEKEKLTTMGVAFGVVGAGVMYGAAMFIIARRYKRKKQTHRRSSSMSNSQDSSEMRYTGGASSALMGGALPSRDYFSYRPEGRDSHGSGMGNSGRTANISAPASSFSISLSSKTPTVSLFDDHLSSRPYYYYCFFFGYPWDGSIVKSRSDESVVDRHPVSHFLSPWLQHLTAAQPRPCILETGIRRSGYCLPET